MVRYLLFCIALLFVSMESNAQNGFASVHLQRKYTFVQQPVQVTIKVYSPTWFTQGVEFGDLTVKDAFIIPFTNSVSGNETINGKYYAVIKHYFLVFPYKEGTFTFPSLSLVAYIPPKGDFEGKATTLKTKEQTFKVRPLPPNKENVIPFVASRVYISDYWNKDFKKLKVGDVVERTVKVTAVKTIANFIPPVKIDSVDYAKRYYNSNLTDQKINSKKETLVSTRTEKFSYLFAKPGDYEMPGSSITYFDPYRGEYKTVKSKASKIHVDTTSDLGIVASIADSLQSLQPKVDTNAAPKVPLKERIITFLVEQKVNIVLFFLIVFFYKRVKKWLLKLIKWYKSRRENYLNSEKYAFSKVEKKSKYKNDFEYLNEVYRWLLHSAIGKVSITASAKEIKDTSTYDTFSQFFVQLFSKKEKGEHSSLQSQLRKFRKKITHKEKNKSHLKDW